LVTGFGPCRGELGQPVVLVAGGPVAGGDAVASF